jgi:hypothetical protein
MNSLPTPAALADYRISLFDAADAAQILQKTGKVPRVTADRAAVLLNFAVQESLGRIGEALASPPSEHAAWAAQLAEALQCGLSLLAPDSTATHAPINSNLIDAYARLFNAGIPPEVDGLLERYGFKSPQQALELGAIGLWFVHAFAVHSAAEWRKKVRPPDDMDRRRPEAARLVWVQAMGNLYSALVDATPPRAPIADSPFIQFCEQVGAIVLARCPPSTERTLRHFLEMLRDAKPAPLAAFMSRHKGAWTWGANAPPAEQAATTS